VKGCGEVGAIGSPPPSSTPWWTPARLGVGSRDAATPQKIWSIINGKRMAE
jgi:hypothetical protein